jgi:hypothetical protein
LPKQGITGFGKKKRKTCTSLDASPAIEEVAVYVWRVVERRVAAVEGEERLAKW